MYKIEISDVLEKELGPKVWAWISLTQALVGDDKTSQSEEYKAADDAVMKTSSLIMMKKAATIKANTPQQAKEKSSMLSKIRDFEYAIQAFKEEENLKKIEGLLRAKEKFNKWHR